jgi:hypothetical protein
MEMFHKNKTRADDEFEECLKRIISSCRVEKPPYFGMPVGWLSSQQVSGCSGKDAEILRFTLSTRLWRAEALRSEGHFLKKNRP